MGKYNWKDDPQLRVWLMDSAPAPKAISGPKFYSQYRFVIRKTSGDVEVKQFVPEWALNIVKNMLDADSTVRDYFYNLTYKGNVPCRT